MITQKQLYNKERDADGYENIFMKHMLAMTNEDLHSKAAIAVELAYRDWQIEQLREALKGLLRCPAIHDVYGDDKDEETHEAERIARKALDETK